MGVIVIACYKPLPGKDGELAGLMKTHLERLKNEDLVTGRKSIIMRSAGGTVVEVFEWKSEKAIEQAHTNPNVRKMWEEFDRVCEYIPVNQLEEAGELFPGFTPLF